jgi:hypothetical protein
MEVNVLAVCNVLSAYLCDPYCGSAVYRLYGCHYRRGAENRRDTQRKLFSKATLL